MLILQVVIRHGHRWTNTANPIHNNTRNVTQQTHSNNPSDLVTPVTGAHHMVTIPDNSPLIIQGDNNPTPDNNTLQGDNIPRDSNPQDNIPRDNINIRSRDNNIPRVNNRQWGATILGVALNNNTHSNHPQWRAWTNSLNHPLQNRHQRKRRNAIKRRNERKLKRQRPQHWRGGSRRPC